MTTIGKLFVGVIILILLGGGYFYFSNKSGTGEDTKPAPVETASILGCYVAKLSKDVYTLQIKSESKGEVSGMLAYNNYEKDSSSGGFTGTLDGTILLGTYSFDSEGMHSNRQVIFKKVGSDFVEGFGPVQVLADKEMFLDTTKVTYDPKSTFKKTADCQGSFTDSKGNVSFNYNAFFTASGGSATPTLDWKLDAKQKGILLASVSAPRGYMPKTNFSEAHLTIGRSADQNEIKSCMTDLADNDTALESATISGQHFLKFMVSDAGAGNFYETTSYRGIVDGDCYAVEYTIHSTNIGNYDPSQGIKEFDKAKIVAEMEKIVQSLKFLINSD